LLLFLQFQKTALYELARERGARFIDSTPRLKSPTFKSSDESLEGFAERIDGKWKKWKEENAGGRIIITQGMGPDGHTAGVMPFPEDPELFARLFLDESRWVVGYDAGTKSEHSRRATAALSFMKNDVSAAIAYIAGTAKQSAFSAMMSTSGTLAETPARIMHEMHGVHVFTDLKV